MKVKTLDTQIRENMKEYYEYKRMGRYEEADLILKLTANMEANRAEMRPTMLTNGCSIM